MAHTHHSHTSNRVELSDLLVRSRNPVLYDMAIAPTPNHADYVVEEPGAIHALSDAAPHLSWRNPLNIIPALLFGVWIVVIIGYLATVL